MKFEKEKLTQVCLRRQNRLTTKSSKTNKLTDDLQTDRPCANQRTQLCGSVQQNIPGSRRYLLQRASWRHNEEYKHTHTARHWSHSVVSAALCV